MFFVAAVAPTDLGPAVIDDLEITRLLASAILNMVLDGKN